MSLNREQEEQLWHDLYMMQDTNENHCEDAFVSNNIGAIGIQELHNKNITNIKWFLSTGSSVDDIITNCPLAEALIPEISEP